MSTINNNHVIQHRLTIRKIIGRLFAVLLLSGLSMNSYAQTRLAILDFELSDVTLAPGIPAEVARTASIKALLEGELQRAGYAIIPISLDNQHEANGGFGYLFDHNDVAASLGQKAGADYILIGKLHKPSFLFAYLMGHLVNTHTGQQMASYTVETKGGDKKLTLKAVETLASKIDQDLDHIYSPPPPKQRAETK